MPYLQGDGDIVIRSAPNYWRCPVHHPRQQRSGSIRTPRWSAPPGRAPLLGDLPGRRDQLGHVRAEFPAATVERDDALLAPEASALLDHLSGRRPDLDLPLDVQGTAFQARVWAALRAIPRGETRFYAQVAAAIGAPAAVRAVAGACAKNPVALVAPCHRVVRADGSLSGYRWGADRKRRLLEGEGADV